MCIALLAYTYRNADTHRNSHCYIYAYCYCNCYKHSYAHAYTLYFAFREPSSLPIRLPFASLPMSKWKYRSAYQRRI
jgi:hypothetical protein